MLSKQLKSGALGGSGVDSEIGSVRRFEKSFDGVQPPKSAADGTSRRAHGRTFSSDVVVAGGP